MSAELADALAKVLGAGAIDGLRRLSGGASRATWAFEADGRALILRMDPPGATSGGLAREADLEWLMIDSTIVRAHQHAAGARKEKGGRMPRAWAGLAAG